MRAIMARPKPETFDKQKIVADNRRARFDYFIEETFEAGLVLMGWEVKSLREGRAQVTEAYVVIRNREAFLIGAHFTPLKQASTHVNPDATRTRKLLMHRKELDRLRSDAGRLNAKLGNASFVDRAPEAVVQKERDRLKETEAMIGKLEEQHRRIAGML